MYGHKLTIINKDDVKVGDVVGIAYRVRLNYMDVYKHPLIKAVKISKITPKRTKFVSENGKEFSKNIPFYLLDEKAEKETKLALAAEKYNKASFKVADLERVKGINNIPDNDVELLAELMSEIAEILNGKERDTD